MVVSRTLSQLGKRKKQHILSQVNKNHFNNSSLQTAYLQ